MSSDIRLKTYQVWKQSSQDTCLKMLIVLRHSLSSDTSLNTLSRLGQLVAVNIKRLGVSSGLGGDFEGTLE